MEINLIVAMDNNRCIGKNGKLPFAQKSDMARFKMLTMGNIVVMGRKTFDSLGQKPLPGRMNYVISSDATKLSQVYFSNQNVQFFRTPKACIEFLYDLKGLAREAFIIGGESVYKEFLHLASRIYATYIETEIEGGDTFFPEIPEDFIEEDLDGVHPMDGENEFNYYFVDYVRK